MTDDAPDLLDLLNADAAIQQAQSMAAGVAGMQQAEDASDDWEKSIIDQAILACARTGRPFSANSVRPLLPPGVRTSLIGSRFRTLAGRGLIRDTERTERTTDKGTHGKKLPLWIGAEFARSEDAA